MAGGDSRAPEIEDMCGGVGHGARHWAGFNPSFVVVGYDKIADFDLADRLLPDFR